MVGLRGVPLPYSGIETAVEEIGARLAGAGHEVTVYCMANRYAEKPRRYRGMRLVYVPTIKSKNLEMIVYCLLATMHVLVRRPDVVHFHAVGPASMCMLAWLGRLPSVVTVHALDWVREKWSYPAQFYLRLGARAACRFADRIICVSKTMQEFMQATYSRSASYIPNGTRKAEKRPLCELGQSLRIEPQRYILFVGRLVPEKKVDQLILAFRKIETDLQLVIVGGSQDDAFDRLGKLAEGDSRIRLTGPVYGDDLDRLYANAALFVLPSVVEGLPLVLLEALSFDLPLLVSDIPANLEVISDGKERLADTFRAGDLDDLTRQLRSLCGSMAVTRQAAAGRARRLLERYDWDAIAKGTLALYREAQAKSNRQVRWA